MKQVIKSLALNAMTIITGGAKGADTLDGQYAKEHNLELVVEIKPGYKKYIAKVALLMRNTIIVANYYKVQSGVTLDMAKKVKLASKLLAEVIDGKIIKCDNDLLLF